MKTPEEIAALIIREHADDARVAAKLPALLTSALKPFGLENDSIFRSKVSRELVKLRLARIAEEKAS